MTSNSLVNITAWCLWKCNLQTIVRAPAEELIARRRFTGLWKSKRHARREATLELRERIQHV